MSTTTPPTAPAATSTASASPTSTYRSITVTSFPFNPLTTTFTPPPQCSGIYEAGNLMVDPQTSCLPSGHNKLETAYFSPGYVCPSGYLTAKVDNRGVNSITTVTCCPARSDIILSAVDPATLSGPWVGLFCTWIAPSYTTLDVTQTTGGVTWTQQMPVESPGGLNAYGIRMVYQQSDLAGRAMATGGSSATETPSVSVQGVSTGIPHGAALAMAAVIPVAVFSLIAGAVFWWWKRKQKQQRPYGKVDEAGSPNPGLMKPPAPAMSPSLSMLHSGPYDPPHQHYPNQQMPHMHSMQSLQSSSAPSSQHPQSFAYAQPHGVNNAAVSYAYYKPADPNVTVTLQSTPVPTPAPSAEMPAVVPSELPPGHQPSVGEYIDTQKVRGMPPL